MDYIKKLQWIEKSTENNFTLLTGLKNETTSLNGLKTFNTGIKTNTILSDTDVTIDGISTTDIKTVGQTITVPGYGTLALSASTENAKRVTSAWPSIGSPGYNPPDFLTSFQYVGSIYDGYFYTQYNDSNNFWIKAASGRGATTGYVTLTDITTGTIIINNQYFTGPSLIGTTTYYSITAGHYYRIYMTADVNYPPVFNVRRCKYPIVQNDLVKVYDTNYGTTSSRIATVDDINNFRLG